MIIQPTGGLCNRLRVVFSYYKYSKYLNQKLIIIWEPLPTCNGYFLDYFQEIDDDVIFEKNNKHNEKIFYKGGKPHPKFNQYNYAKIYEKLKLLTHLQENIQNKIKTMNNNYIAVHIRRTDHINLAKRNNRYTSDQEFIDFIKNRKESNVYVATDNKITYNQIKYELKKYNKNIFNFCNFLSNRNRRKTNLEDSIVDLFMCVYANNFKGSGYSSFSDLIKQLRLHAI